MLKELLVEKPMVSLTFIVQLKSIVVVPNRVEFEEAQSSV